MKNTVLSFSDVRYAITLSLILLSSWIFHAYYLGFFSDYETQIYIGDQSSYIEAAKNLYTSFTPHEYRTFAYPFFIGLPCVFGFEPVDFYWPLIVNLAFLAAILMLSLKIDREVGHKISLFVVLGLALSTGYMKSAGNALTEIPFSFFMLLNVYFFLRVLNAATIRITDTLLFFASIGFSVLIRPGFVYFAILVPVFLFIWMCMEKYPLSNIFLHTSIGALTLSVLLFSQMFWMQQKTGEFKLSYIGEVTWYRYAGALSGAIAEKDCFTNECYRTEQARRDSIIADKPVQEIARISDADRTDQFNDHRNAVIKAIKINWMTNLLSGTVKDVPSVHLQYLYTKFSNLVLTLLPLFLGFVYVVFNFFKKSNTSPLLYIIFPCLIVLYTFLLSGISNYQGDRFHIVFYPLSFFIFGMLFFNMKAGLMKEQAKA